MTSSVTEKHRGFAFVEFELAEDAAAAIDNLASIFLIPVIINYFTVWRYIWIVMQSSGLQT